MKKGSRHRLPFLSLRSFMFESQLVRHHRDEFRVRRFGFGHAYGVAEQGRNRFEIAAAPSDFNRMADRPLDTASGRVVFFRDVWVKHFRNCAEQFNIVIYHRDRFT